MGNRKPEAPKIDQYCLAFEQSYFLHIYHREMIVYGKETCVLPHSVWSSMEFSVASKWSVKSIFIWEIIGLYFRIDLQGILSLSK